MKKKKHIIQNHMLPIAAFTTAAFLMLSGCGKAGEASNLEQGFNAIKSGNYAATEALFNAALEDGTGEKEVLRGKGISALASGDYDGAIECFRNALALSNGIVNDMDIDISYYMAVAEHRSGDISGAIKTYDAIINMRPKDDNAYYMRGKAYLSAGDRQKALEDYETAVSLAPNDYNHYLRICEDLSDAGYESDGRGYIQKALDANPKLSDYQLGVFNYYLGNYTEARNYLENARNDKNSPKDLIMHLGKTYDALGDADYALTLYQSYITEGNPSATAYLSIGLIKMKQQDFQAAADAFESGIEQQDESCMQSLLYNRIVAYEYLRDFDTAKNYMSEYISRYPGDEKAIRENIFLSTR